MGEARTCYLVHLDFQNVRGGGLHGYRYMHFKSLYVIIIMIRDIQLKWIQVYTVAQYALLLFIYIVHLMW